MFKKLKRKFILTNLLTSTAVLLIAFASIYIVAANTTSGRDFKKYEHPQAAQQAQPQSDLAFTAEDVAKFNEEMAERIEAERAAALQSLLISLIAAGVSVEIAVALISILLAEQSIKPVRDAYNAQKEFVANASHEIKTPLAVIQANLEASGVEGNRWVDTAAKKAGDLAELNNQLLTLARSDSISDNPKLKTISLNNLVSDAILAFTPHAAEKDIKLTQRSALEDTDQIKLNATAFEQILNIYIDNAIKYGHKLARVEIKKDRIDVVSDGKLISEDKLDHLFDRFYQADKTTEGVGLGLAIAKSLAEKNHWKVYASVDKNRRLNVFTLEFK